MPRSKANEIARALEARGVSGARLPGDGGEASGRATPLYARVESHLRALIDSGHLVPGDLIPSEPQLAAALGVSTGTVKKAIENLVHQKVLFRHQGKGTYVSRIDFNNSLFRFFTYGDAEGKGARIHKETTVRARLRGPRDVYRRLHLPTDSELLYIERVGYDADAPVLLERSWWPADLLPGLDNEEVHIPDLMYAMVSERFGIMVVRSEETLTAGAADEDTARQLEIAPGTPVVVLKRVTYSTANRIIEFRITKGRADKFSYKAEIR
jgi:GntR family transcriptional regulator